MYISLVSSNVESSPLEGWMRGVRGMDRVLDKGCPHKALFSCRNLEAKVSSFYMLLGGRATLKASAPGAEVQLPQDPL